MAKELFIQECKLLSLFSEKACMIIDSDDRIINILATESLRLQRKQVIEGMYPSYIPILVRMIMIDPTNESIWLVDESCGTNRVYKEIVKIVDNKLPTSLDEDSHYHQISRGWAGKSAFGL